MEKLVRAVVPDFPEDRKVQASRDVVAWYRINVAQKVLYVPPMNVLKTNMREIDRFAEAVRAFAIADLSAVLYNWTNLNLFEATTVDKAIQMMQEMRSYILNKPESERGWISVDIETRRVEWEDNKLLSIGFAVDEDTAFAFYNLDWKEPRLWNALQEFLAMPDAVYIWQNGKFDCGRLAYLLGLVARVDEDTMLKHFVSINEKQGTHGLKAMGQLYLQAPAWDDELDQIKRDWCKQNKRLLKEFMYDDIPTSVLIPYMQRDCIATYRLLKVFNELARPGSDFIYRQLVRASNVYCQIELAGQCFDLDGAEELEFELDTLIAEASKKMQEVATKIWNPELYKAMTGAKSATEAFNVKSPKQLKWMLQEVVGHPVNSTDAVTMQMLLDNVEKGIITNPVAKEFIESIGAVRKYSKYLETYAIGMRENMCSDRRIRCTFNLHGTETGRLSSSGPNMQNIPRNKMIKNLLIATPGWKLLQLDYSQAELRVLAMLSEDPALIKVYQDGKDLHDAVADMMFGEGGHKDKELRNLAKTINFGIAYGRGPSSIAEKFGKTMAESRQIIEKWFAPMPKVRDFINMRRKMATRGEPCVTLTGRERHFIITNEELNHIQNEYINTPIQSLASDFTMLSLLDIYDYIQANYPNDARITTTVHDSIILEVRDGIPELILKIAEECIDILAKTPLKYVPSCTVPFVADAEIGYKWGEMYKLDMETGMEVPK